MSFYSVLIPRKELALTVREKYNQILPIMFKIMEFKIEESEIRQCISFVSQNSIASVARQMTQYSVGLESPMEIFQGYRDIFHSFSDLNNTEMDHLANRVFVFFQEIYEVSIFILKGFRLLMNEHITDIEWGKYANQLLNNIDKLRTFSLISFRLINTYKFQETSHIKEFLAAVNNAESEFIDIGGILHTAVVDIITPEVQLSKDIDENLFKQIE